MCARVPYCMCCFCTSTMVGYESTNHACAYCVCANECDRGSSTRMRLSYVGPVGKCCPARIEPTKGPYLVSVQCSKTRLTSACTNSRVYFLHHWARTLHPNCRANTHTYLLILIFEGSGCSTTRIQLHMHTHTKMCTHTHTCSSKSPSRGPALHRPATADATGKLLRSPRNEICGKKVRKGASCSSLPCNKICSKRMRKGASCSGPPATRSAVEGCEKVQAVQVYPKMRPAAKGCNKVQANVTTPATRSAANHTTADAPPQQQLRGRDLRQVSGLVVGRACTGPSTSPPSKAHAHRAPA